MKSHRSIGMGELTVSVIVLNLLLAIAVGTATADLAEGTDRVVIWDTQARLGETIRLADRGGWKAVPADLFTLEADPAKAFSDPGYYGREYTFAGDTVLENDRLVVVFRSDQGVVAVYSKADPAATVAELAPLWTQGAPRGIRRCRVLENARDEAAIEVVFSAEASVVFSLDRTGIIGVKPAGEVTGIKLQSAIDYGVAPDFIADDLILNPAQYPATDTLFVPAENLFLGLLTGEHRLLVLTWPQGKPQMRLGLGAVGEGTRRIESIELDSDGQSLYLALLEAPGIWHREPLTSSYLEKDVAIGWKPPFPAKWITQLEEAGVKTTFAFRATRGQIWRGVPGMYVYPVWFDGDKTSYRLTKKIPPRGESLIYFLEGRDTPASIRTPVDVLKTTLGRPACETILDLPGRKLRTHHRRAGEGIRRACTCGCTEAIEAVFQAGQEVEKKEYIEGAVGDMVYFVTRHMERIDEYRSFAERLVKLLHEKAAASPELKPYLDDLEQIVTKIPQGYEVQKENIKTLAFTDELARRTIALTRQKDAKNLPTCLDLGKQWRGMGGAQDGLLAEYHMIGRRLFQEAGYACLDRPAAVELAREIRAMCRQCLRNADGYEIWPNY